MTITQAYDISVIFIMVLILGAIIRLVKGPSAPDRVVALDAVNTLVVAIMVLLSAAYRQTFFADVAIVYALLSFVGTIYLAKYLGGEST